MGLCGVHYSWRSDHLSEKKRSKARRQRVIVECEDKTGLLRGANSDS